MHEGGDDVLVFHHPRVPAGGTVPDIEDLFCYVTTTGRRTGRAHRIEIWFAPGEERTIYVLSGGRDRADWVRNLVADPKVTVRIRAEEGDATARVIDPTSDEDALARRLLLAKYQRPGKDDLVDWARTSLPVAFDLGF